MAMNEQSMKTSSVLSALKRALDAWCRYGNEQPLTRWFNRELDSEGALMHLDITEWRDCVKYLLESEPQERVWPVGCLEPLTKLLRAVLWYSRPDGTPGMVFAPAEANGRIAWSSLLDSNLCKDPAIARTIKPWLSNRTNGRGEHAVADWGTPNRALAMLRPGWPEEVDFVAIDHRAAGSACRFELFGGGRSWLGPTWEVGAETGGGGIPRPRSWTSDPSGTLAEWSYRAGEVRITQSALVLRGRSLALLAAFVEKRSALSSCPRVNVSLPPGILAEPIENSRALSLAHSSKRGSAQVLPIGLPSLAYATERGDFRVQDGALVLSQSSHGRRCWLPLLVSWDSRRNRKELHWRILSVSEKSRNVPADRAFAVRVSWGRNETYLIYHSLAKPAARAFLGHQTTARFLVGLFKPDGTVEPIMRID
jgi:hypothetical protein